MNIFSLLHVFAYYLFVLCQDVFILIGLFVFIVILAMTEVQNCHFIDFNTALKLINLLHDPTYSKTDLMSLYNFYKMYFYYYL